MLVDLNNCNCFVDDDFSAVTFEKRGNSCISTRVDLVSNTIRCRRFHRETKAVMDRRGNWKINKKDPEDDDLEYLQSAWNRAQEIAERERNLAIANQRHCYCIIQ